MSSRELTLEIGARDRKPESATGGAMRELAAAARRGGKPAHADADPQVGRRLDLMA